MENHKTALRCPTEKTCHIGVCQGTSDYLLPLAQQFNRPEPVPNLCGPLKTQFLRRPLHLLRQVLLHVLEPSLQKGHRLRDGLRMLLPQLVSPAVAVAFAHVKVEAWPFLTDIPGKFFVAGRQAKGSFQGVDNALGAVAASVRTKIPGAVLRRLGGQGKFGVRLVGQADIGVSLAVLQ